MATPAAGQQAAAHLVTSHAMTARCGAAMTDLSLRTLQDIAGHCRISLASGSQGRLTTAPLQPGAVRYLRERKSLIQPAPKIATHGADGGEKVDGWCLS